MSSRVDAFTYIAIATGAFFFLAGTVGLFVAGRFGASGGWR